MADAEDHRFQLLLSEKQFADTQIGSFFDLHVKVLTFLGAAVVLLGWLFSDSTKKPGEDGEAIIALALVVIGCSVILQAIVLYGASLGYLEYKMTTLNSEFWRILPLRRAPFTAFWDWRHSSTQPPVTLSAIALFAMHAVVSSVLLRTAWDQGVCIPHFDIAVIGAGIYLLVTLSAEVMIFRAIRTLMEQGKRESALLPAQNESKSHAERAKGARADEVQDELNDGP